MFSQILSPWPTLQERGAGKHIYMITNQINQILTFPMANNALSNNNIMPKNIKNMPNPAKPTPISKISNIIKHRMKFASSNYKKFGMKTNFECHLFDT